MWLWIFYRAEQDGAVLLVSSRGVSIIGEYLNRFCPYFFRFWVHAALSQGLVHPWDAHSHDDGADDFKFVKEDIGDVPTLESHGNEEEDEEE